MPYTPPSQLSPVASKTSTPNPSRSSSYINGELSPALQSPSFAKPDLPRSNSSSYLNRSRRSPSTPTGNEMPEAMTDLQRGIGFDPHGSLRQSPPPLTNGVIPSGMTISPPDSLPNSDDEDATRGRGRELEIRNLQELQAAIRSIKGERKSGSPVRSETQQSSHDHTYPADSRRPPLSSQQRKISHSRSNTDSNVVFEPPQQQQTLLTPTYGQQDSDTEESDGSNSRPPMVRKKSGELVRPALRASSRRRPSSMPGTPTYSKAVHFDSQLEHIRHFLQVDRPLAVSAGSSPVDNYESESEFPFGSDENSARSRSSSYEWEIRLANFPTQTDERKAQPLHVERVFVSADKKHMIGTVAVQNLSFQKLVVARFTLDYWKTVSEVTAEYNNDAQRGVSDGLDRFNFSISLADQANLENKTLFFCVRYAVNGTEYWDSNSNVNYQVDFTKKPKVKAPQSAPGLGARPLNALPRSRPSPTIPSGRPKSMPVSFDDFASGFDNFGSNFGQTPAAIIGEPRIKLRSPRSKNELVPDAPAARRNKSSAPMFGHRYDFNSSLTAAKNNAYSILGDQSGLPNGAKQSSREVPAVAANKNTTVSQKLENGGQVAVAGPVKTPTATASTTTVKPAALVTEKPPLTSQSYQELVEKYCFFGSAKSSPTMTRTLAPAGDGAHDDHSVSDMSMGSAESSGASTPVPGGQSPSPPSEVSSVKTFSPHSSRSSSPLPYIGSCSNSRSSSPAAYRYRYHQSSSQTLLAEAPQATAIHG